MSLEDLYRDQLLAASRDRRYRGRHPSPAREARADNPLCGDELVLTGGQNHGLWSWRYEAEACAVCQASLHLLCHHLEQRSLSDAVALRRDFLAALDSASASDATEAGRLPEDLSALLALRRHPARLRCLCLPWRALGDCLTSADEPEESPR